MADNVPRTQMPDGVVKKSADVMQLKPIAFPMDVAPAFFRPNICRTCFGFNSASRLANYFRKDCKLCKRSFKSMKWDGLGLNEIRTTEVCNKCSDADKVCRVCGQACLEAEHLFNSIRVQEETARNMTDIFSPSSDEEDDEAFGHPLLNLSYIC
ncbi:hypothetical protein ACHQM5_015272 [Ranunculus cassubicifolius]